MADHGWEKFDDRPLLGATYGGGMARMFAFGLRDGGLCVVSPGGRDEARFTELERHGTPRFLLAPNAYHNLGLEAWKRRYPEARCVAHPRALPRLRKRLPQLGLEDLSALDPQLPDGVRAIPLPMARQGEVWISARTADGCAWFVTDAIMNNTELPGGALGWLMWAMGFRTGLMTNPLFKRVFLDGRTAYKDWVRQRIREDAPTLFVPSHGAVLRGPDVAQRLLDVTDRA